MTWDRGWTTEVRVGVKKFKMKYKSTLKEYRDDF
nr:MAG TPA: hypothetical protein [Bacteriophage sp.]